MTIQPKTLKNKIAALFNRTTYSNLLFGHQNMDWQISPKALKNRFNTIDSKKKLELIAVLPNLKLPFEVQQTIPIDEFSPETIAIDTNKTYVMVCQKGFNSYKATKALKEAYPNLEVLNLTGGISAYNEFDNDSSNQ